ncbi:hypothetical protein E4T39_08127 [Aureobasidium subglaciale]|nr:hypothetical protein E4T39_08127 [Aureobasidium subglaciale]
MTTSNILSPFGKVKISKHQIPAHGLIPNTSIQRKPLLLYRNAFSVDVSAGQIEEHLRKIGIVEPAWRYTMYPTSHFHTTCHEVLCISSGSASLCFGHEDNPSCVKEVVKKGDVVIVPAGVAHRLLEDLEGGFEMVGSYPKGGKSWDMCYGKQGEEGKVQGIKGLGWFGADPVFGERGPVMDV